MINDRQVKTALADIPDETQISGPPFMTPAPVIKKDISSTSGFPSTRSRVDGDRRTEILAAGNFFRKACRAGVVKTTSPILSVLTTRMFWYIGRSRSDGNRGLVIAHSLRQPRLMRIVSKTFSTSSTEMASMQECGFRTTQVPADRARAFALHHTARFRPRPVNPGVRGAE